VNYFLDGKQIASLSQPPYTLPWQTPPVGMHILQVEAVDLAENHRKEEVSFEVK
jgi:hypothetical protein